MEQEKDPRTDPLIDVNNNNLYAEVQYEIDKCSSKLKKWNEELNNNLRIAAAELEVQTAALFHAELFKINVELEAIIEEVDEEIRNVTP